MGYMLYSKAQWVQWVAGGVGEGVGGGKIESRYVG